MLMTRDEMKLRGLHNVENVLAALAAGLACGAAPESMRETVSDLSRSSIGWNLLRRSRA